MTEYKLGKDRVTGEIVVITNARRGRTCDCVCPDCKKDFVAAQGDKNEWHFRHYDKTTCKGGQETALHLLAKDIIASNTQIILPFHGTVFYDNTVKEKYFQTIQPDVTANTSGQNLFFEVLVTHRVDTAKENFYKNGEHKSVEIDLQKHAFTTREDLEKEILTNCDNKRIIFWEKKVVAEKSNDNSWVLWLAFGVLAFLGLKSSFQRRR
jgi:hypothetical protein